MNNAHTHQWRTEVFGNEKCTSLAGNLHQSSPPNSSGNIQCYSWVVVQLDVLPHDEWHAEQMCVAFGGMLLWLPWILPERGYVCQLEGFVHVFQCIMICWWDVYDEISLIAKQLFSEWELSVNLRGTPYLPLSGTQVCNTMKWTEWKKMWTMCFGKFC